MLIINLEYDGKKDIVDAGALPPIGSEIIHPQWGGLRVKDISFSVYPRPQEPTITLSLSTEESYKASLMK